MLLVWIIFIFNIILAFLSIDFARIHESFEQIKLAFFASIFILSLTLIFFLFWQKRALAKKDQKILLIKNEFIHSKEIDIETSLDLIREKIAHLNQDLFKISHEKETYAKLLEDSLYQIGNIEGVVRCLDEEEASREIKSLVLNALKHQKEQIRLGLNQALEYHKSIGVAQGNVLQFEASAAIVSDDELESFLLANLLSYFGIENTIFKSLSFDINDFHVVFIKDKILEQSSKKADDFIVFGRSKNLYYEYFLSLPFEKKELENILQRKLDKICVLKFQTPYQNNVLLFKQNEFDATLFFNIIEKQCSQNMRVNSFSELKKELKKEAYRLVLLDYELIKFDLEQMRSILSAYKKQHPQSHIIFFSKERVRDFDCVSEVLNDISRNDLIALIRKYLPKN
ncbi:hypothetical protein K7E43_000067 [Campylobacter coli]|uniref:Uncharacterized protein n=1 Tax=Campylobacter coli TaxID=195 RepID=A0A1T1ZJY6_CAMCO|nr:hypothetical protein [Campylobacter coli]MCW1352925.1 hypothetical protein [Campylobacter jejuni]EAH6860812.1 hypothetical protein [Campylobacter coli]EAH7177523.1 hypothetical protein [Campylobacter coli]EAH7180530.1 hypothetical protein [Campylobacter coli]EAH7501053.1 hypothetical protein [Campylobacter coli]